MNSARNVLFCFLVSFCLTTNFVLTLKAPLINQASLTDYVPVPGGNYFHKSCVHHVGNNAHVKPYDDGSFFVLSEDGYKNTIPPCRYPKLSLAIGDGWQVFADFNSGPNTTSYNASWNVPDAPSVAAKQIVYTFPGMQNSFQQESEQGGVDIIQPVLQFGKTPAGGGHWWAVASWYVTSTGAALFSTPQNVSTGDIIFGVMSKANASAENWTISALDVNSNVSTSMFVDKALGKIERWCFVTLEVYDVNGCKQYPTKPLSYTGLSVAVSNAPVTPKWTNTSQQQICKENCIINSPENITINF